MEKILITGATGTVGSAVVKSLIKANANFVAGVRDTAKAKEKLGVTTPLVTFDFADKSTYATAIEGVDRVFLLGPPLNMELDTLLAPFIDFLKSKNILRVTYLSAYGMEKISDQMPFHKNIEQKLKADGFQLTIVRPSFFAQNFKNYEWENITQRKIIYMPAGSGVVAFVDIADVGDIIAKTLTEKGHEGKDYVVTGPENLSYHDVANLLTTICKETISYPAPTAAEFTQTLKATGAPDFIAPYMTTVYSLIANGHAAHVSQTTMQLLGREATSLKKVLERDFA